MIHKHMCDWEVFWVKRIDCQEVCVHRCDILAARFFNHHFQGRKTLSIAFKGIELWRWKRGLRLSQSPEIVSVGHY